MAPKPVMGRHVSLSRSTALACRSFNRLCNADPCARQRWLHRGHQSASSMQPLSPLHRAAQRGEVEELRRLVQKVAQILFLSDRMTMTRRIAVDMCSAFPQELMSCPGSLTS